MNVALVILVWLAFFALLWRVAWISDVPLHVFVLHGVALGVAIPVVVVITFWLLAPEHLTWSGGGRC